MKPPPKIILSLTLALAIFWPGLLPRPAEASGVALVGQNETAAPNEQIFKAQVLEVMEEKNETDEAGVTIHQQNLRIRGLEGVWLDKEINIQGISDIVVLEAARYKTGENIYVNYRLTPDGEEKFYALDHVRTPALWWLAGLFAAVVLLIGRWAGLRALLVLAATFAIIIKFIIPRIVAGSDPITIAIIGSLGILFLAIFGTEGFSRKSAVAFGSITLSLGLILLLSKLFTDFAHLSGLETEEAAYLLSLGNLHINLQGLLLAGIIIGALGVLDDIIMSQVSLVKELADANPDMKAKTMFATAMRVGTDHINAIVNTLFLAYAGVSLPLLVLFTIYNSPNMAIGSIINRELFATEIVRTLVGSIALVLSVPVATYLAVKTFCKK